MKLAIPRDSLLYSLGGFVLTGFWAISPLSQWRSGSRHDSFWAEVLVVYLGFAVTVSLILYQFIKSFAFSVWRENKKFEVELAEGESLCIGPLEGLSQKSIYTDIVCQLPISLQPRMKSFRLSPSLPSPVIEYEIKLISKADGRDRVISKKALKDWAYNNDTDSSDVPSPTWEYVVPGESGPLYFQIEIGKIELLTLNEKTADLEKQWRESGKLKVKVKGNLKVGLRTVDIRNVGVVSMQNSAIQILGRESA